MLPQALIGFSLFVLANDTLLFQLILFAVGYKSNGRMFQKTTVAFRGKCSDVYKTEGGEKYKKFYRLGYFIISCLNLSKNLQEFETVCAIIPLFPNN